MKWCQCGTYERPLVERASYRVVQIAWSKVLTSYMSTNFCIQSAISFVQNDLLWPWMITWIFYASTTTLGKLRFCSALPHLAFSEGMWCCADTTERTSIRHHQLAGCLLLQYSQSDSEWWACPTAHWRSRRDPLLRPWCSLLLGPVSLRHHRFLGL